ncbi:hypothetical protein [Salibacterium sp. K-3]
MNRNIWYSSGKETALRAVTLLGILSLDIHLLLQGVSRRKKG